MKRVVFDAYAVLAWMNGEPGSGTVASMLTEVSEGRLWGGICSVNIGEVYYTVSRTRGRDRAEEILRNLLLLGWQVLDASRELIWAAARLKASYPISYADAFALASAEIYDAGLVTNDPELRKAKHGVPLVWGMD